MFVGILRLTLHLPEPGSLKSKRHLLRSALDRVRARYPVAIAEVGENDTWQRSVVGVAAVGNDHAFVNELLDKVTGFVGNVHGGQVLITDREMEIVPFGTTWGADGARWRTPRRTTMAHDRPARVAEEFQHEVSAILTRGLKDPRVVGFITVTGAKMSPDLREVTVFVSVHGDEAVKRKTVEGLTPPPGSSSARQPGTSGSASSLTCDSSGTPASRRATRFERLLREAKEKDGR